MKTLERIGIAAVAAGAAFAVAAATVQGSSERGGFIDVPRGEFARFAGTTVTCVSPKGQIPGGQVACDVDYVRWRNISHPAPTKYIVGLTLQRCIDVTKWPRGGGGMLKSTRLC